MAVIKVVDFGGEIPRVSPRALPAGGAALYQDLLATSIEFRPLAGDKTVGSGASGARTLYRIGRNADGSLRTDDSSGWIAETADKNYVKGQLNDDATERTVVTWNDGTQRPRVIDAKGADRLLGVPQPAKPILTHIEAELFTAEEAQAWVDETMMPAMVDALRNSLVEARVANNVPVAGARSLHGRTYYPDRPWFLAFDVDKTFAQNNGLMAAELGGTEGQLNYSLPLLVLPMWGRVENIESLKSALRAIENPNTGSQVIPEDKIAELANEMSKQFDPNGESIAADREKMERAALDMIKALDGTSAATNTAPRPVEPTKPNRPEYYYPGAVPGVAFPEGYAIQERHPEWVAYDAAYRQWQSDMEEWEQKNTDATNAQTGLAARVKKIQAEAHAAAQAVEGEYFRRKGEIDSYVRAALDSTSLIGAEGSGALIEVDADPIIDTRFYIVTHVNDWGWESQASIVSDMVECNQDDSVVVTITPPPSDRNITHWRLYRSNVGSQRAEFQFVDEVLATVLTYDDAKKGAELGEPCPTMTWAEPPFRVDSDSAATIKPPKGSDPYLKGAVGMPNGIIAGFIDNFVAFCHPYHPYAWPVEYQITTEHPIVGLGVFGQTLFVGTMGNPYLIHGADSASMSAEKMDSEHSCVSRRSIVSAGDGVIYASPDGLCLARPGGVQLLTGELFSREDWQALQPSSIIAAAHEGVYYFWAGGTCWALDFVARKLGRVVVSATAVHRDIVTDGLFVVSGGSIKKLFSQGRRTATWKSGVAQLPAQAPLAWIHVDSDFADGPVTVEWIGDGALRHTATFSSITPQRLPPGRWLEHELVMTSASRVTKLMLAGHTEELKSA